jgi:hypothetical protein
MCYSGKCIWETYEGDCGYPLSNYRFLKIFPKTLCYTGEDGEGSYYVNKVKIAVDCWKQICRLKITQITEQEIIIKQAERKLKLLNIFSDEQNDNRTSRRNK